MGIEAVFAKMKESCRNVIKRNGPRKVMQGLGMPSPYD
jgi:hypothetical protein